MKIAIIGGGYVGLHTAIRLSEVNQKWKIIIYDVDQEKIDRFSEGNSPIDDYYMDKFMKENPLKFENISYSKPENNWESFDAVFISLSTNPSKIDESRLNTDLIFEISSNIKKTNPTVPIIVRSTINIDDSEKIDNLGLNYWPEFLSQGVETSKNINQKINVISINDKDEKSTRFFNSIFEGKSIINTNSSESILIKVMHNTLDAYLINITNLFANISDENEIDFKTIGTAVEQLLSSRPKVKKPGTGYGGSCYPKDSYSLINITNSEQNKKLIQSMFDFNNEQSHIFLNFENIIKNKKNIIVLGASFKGGTNDLTKTPTLPLRKWLIENNIKYKIWEPMIKENLLMPSEEVSTEIEFDIENSDLVIVSSDWNEFNKLLINYEKTVIDLKSCIVDNGKMNLKAIGRKN